MDNVHNRLVPFMINILVKKKVFVSSVPRVIDLFAINVSFFLLNANIGRGINHHTQCNALIDPFIYI